MSRLLKHFFLFLATNAFLNRMAKKYGLRLGAKRFVAGETLSAALEVVKELNQRGKQATIDHLGEFVADEQEAERMAQECIAALEGMAREKVDANLSLKLTSLGLDISKELCLEHMQRILSTAQRHDNFVRIDMEDFAHLEATLEIYFRLREEYDNVGLVIQAYLYRSMEDMKRLAPLKTNLRLVKGAYRESPEVAFPDKRDVDRHFERLIAYQLDSGNYAAVATHDEAIIAFTKAYTAEKNIPRDRFEFQMLYGIRPDLQERLVKEGYRVRIYVPYGRDWYGYFMRRLAERPANVAFVLKGVFGR